MIPNRVNANVALDWNALNGSSVVWFLAQAKTPRRLTGGSSGGRVPAMTTSRGNCLHTTAKTDLVGQLSRFASASRISRSNTTSSEGTSGASSLSLLNRSLTAFIGATIRK